MAMRVLLVSLCAIFLAPATALAEQRALLVGVGKYLHPGIDLPAIELDVERMHETLNRMGFEDRQIHTLLDEQATSANVVAELDGWLRQGVQANDRVVFYFSGHGSGVPDLNGDEADGVDDVLVTHDMRRARVSSGPLKGRATLAGVVVDDTIGEMIEKNPSRNFWLVVDACHSGTVSRSINMTNRSISSEPVFVKSFSYPGMPEHGESVATRDVGVKQTRESNYVSLAAAHDNESAIGTSRGGIFTIALSEAITRAVAEGKNPTVNELRDETAQYIRSKVDKDQLYSPQVTGSAKLATGALRIVSPTAGTTPGAGPNRKKLLDLVAAQSRQFQIAASSMKYAVDEPVKLTLTIPGAGYLNLVSVDAKDNATVLFPNRYQDSNAVNPGPFQLPTSQMGFELLASEPLGPTLVVAFLSSEPINFYKETLDNRDENGNINADFSSLSHTATRAIRIAPRKSESYGAQLELQITAAAPAAAAPAAAAPTGTADKGGAAKRP